jgi:hypothetical protein
VCLSLPAAPLQGGDKASDALWQSEVTLGHLVKSEHAMRARLLELDARAAAAAIDASSIDAEFYTRLVATAVRTFDLFAPIVPLAAAASLSAAEAFDRVHCSVTSLVRALRQSCGSVDECTRCAIVHCVCTETYRAYLYSFHH